MVITSKRRSATWSNGYPHKGTTGPQRINSQVTSKYCS
jgi:hypothetical protein